MFKPKLAACLIALSMSGCASGRVIDTACSWVQPINVSRQDVMTADTKRQIITHNEKWERVCRTTSQ
jgi:hypothetical protein